MFSHHFQTPPQNHVKLPCSAIVIGKIELIVHHSSNFSVIIILSQYEASFKPNESIQESRLEMDLQVSQM